MPPARSVSGSDGSKGEEKSREAARRAPNRHYQCSPIALRTSQHHHGNPPRAPARDVYKASDRVGWLPVRGTKHEFKLMRALTIQHVAGKKEGEKKKRKKDYHASPAYSSAQEWLEIIHLLVFPGKFCLLLQL